VVVVARSRVDRRSEETDRRADRLRSGRRIARKRRGGDEERKEEGEEEEWNGREEISFFVAGQVQSGSESALTGVGGQFALSL